MRECTPSGACNSCEYNNTGNLYCAGILTEEDEQRRKGVSKRIKAILRFFNSQKKLRNGRFYHMASEIKPGRGLTTKLTMDILGRLSCLRTPSISSVWIQQSSL